MKNSGSCKRIARVGMILYRHSKGNNKNTKGENGYEQRDGGIDRRRDKSFKPSDRFWDMHSSQRTELTSINKYLKQTNKRRKEETKMMKALFAIGTAVLLMGIAI